MGAFDRPKVKVRITATFTATDSYLQLSQAASSLPLYFTEATEGVFSFQDNPMEVVMKEDSTAPVAADRGTRWPAGSYLGVGPVTEQGAGFRLDQMWIRNQTAGSTSVVVFQGVVWMDA